MSVKFSAIYPGILVYVGMNTGNSFDTIFSGLSTFKMMAWALCNFRKFLHTANDLHLS